MNSNHYIIDFITTKDFSVFKRKVIEAQSEAEAQNIAEKDEDVFDEEGNLITTICAGVFNVDVKFENGEE